MSSEIELAWAAGFFDGEGCVSVVKRHTGSSAKRSYLYYQLNLNAPQINKDPLLKLKSLFGGQVRCTRSYGNRRPSFVWTLHAALAEKALRALLPYLIVKKAEAELALQYRATIKPAGNYGRRRVLTDWDWAERTAISEALQEYHKTYVWEVGG